MTQGQYIAVCGPIGVGKSVFAEILADRMEATLVPEVFKENPYLEDFYKPGGIERWGFHTEMAFLSRRFDQMRQIGEMVERGQDVVTDWAFPQVLVYSRITLNDRDFQTYQEIYDRLIQTLPKPDCLVCLDAELGTLISRVQQRGRKMEEAMDPEYLSALKRGYGQWKKRPPYPAAWIDTTDLPIPTSEVAQQQALDAVWERLQACPLPHVRKELRKAQIDLWPKHRMG